MSGATLLDTGISRRGFLKAVGATAGVAAVAGAAGMMTTEDWLKPATAHAEGETRTAHLCHQFHCLTGCNLKCQIRDERVVLIEPSDLVDDKHATCCLRGISEVSHIYSKDRIQTPLKRVGERGEGKFEQITWDEGIKTICDAIKDSHKKHGKDSVFIRKSTEASIGFDWISQLLKADQGGNWGLDRGHANGMNPALGAFTYLSPRSNDEFKYASTIIEAGHNPLESAIIQSRSFVDAVEAGVHIVTVDPRFTGTASKSNEWFAINPGTDAALYQGMIRAIVDNGWYDKDFLAKHTSAPYLVEVKSGKNLRDAKEMCPNPAVVSGEEVGKPYVWDTAAKKAVLYDTPGVKPALEGEFTVDGKKYKTEFSNLKDWISNYDLDWAAETSGIERDRIEALADRYANNGPAIIDFGLGGADKYTNADVVGHTLSILTALTGNYGKKGAGLASYCGLGANNPSAVLNYWTLPEEYGYGDSGIGMYDFPYKENNIHCALTFGDAFTLEAANANKMLDWVKGLDFFGIIDIYHSSAVDYADIVLPACTKFESEENVKQLRDSYGYVMLANGMTKPLFESKTDLQIERLLAAEFGLEDLLPKTYEELARHCLDGVEELDPSMKGITYDALLENGGCLPVAGTETEYLPDGGADQAYATPSGRMELYFEYLKDQGHELPVWEPASEAYEGNPKKAEYPLYFTQGKSRYRLHAYYSASPWFQEDFGPIININPKDAEARGIKTGDDVRVFNDRGSFIASARVNPSMKPGVTFMAETTYTRYYKDGFLQNVTNDTRNERCYEMYHGPQIPYNDTLVQIEKA